ncbi:sugar phosphate isomerase/epimerase [Stieleria sp. ICT_E10.1]|uniref:sugar phosphate isomerase/epimerase family protein n=1 Tax=Stieleria sedimenti TaxID=2976331 RepID=UPI00217F90D7|nr:sugar phosphate isomerase/epimerase [Stieleria sedimenti]MCS7470973.1 sugar phosphate isomerase/epimerase [Stieleria sedimenti]
MTPGFHCSSLEFHHPVTLIPKLAELGFGAVAIRPRRGSWDLDTPWFDSVSAEIAATAKQHGVSIVIDLDAPFYDDPECLDAFSLASQDAAIRDSAAANIRRWIEGTSEMGALAITFSAGRVCPRGGRPPVPEDHGEQILERLAGAIAPLVQLASPLGVNLALRPVSEHAIATVAHFERFGQWIGTEAPLGLAADVGEMLLGGEFPIGARLARLQHRLSCVYMCEPDLERGCDQRFGHGDIDLGRVWEVMTESGYGGPAVFRCCGHGRLGLVAAREALSMLDLS